jgi:uncharacterized protein
VKDVVEVLARALVDQPDEVMVSETPGGGGTVQVTLQVAQADMGKVIGRHGKIARSIRAVANGAAARQGKRAMVDITS